MEVEGVGPICFKGARRRRPVGLAHSKKGMSGRQGRMMPGGIDQRLQGVDVGQPPASIAIGGSHGQSLLPRNRCSSRIRPGRPDKPGQPVQHALPGRDKTRRGPWRPGQQFPVLSRAPAADRPARCVETPILPCSRQPRPPGHGPKQTILVLCPAREEGGPCA